MNLQQIRARLAEIRTLIDNKDKPLTAAELDKLEIEVRELQTKEAAIVAEETANGDRANAERRTNLLNSIANGNIPASIVRNFNGETRGAAGTDGDRLNSTEYRTAFMRFVTRGTPIPTEYRTNETTKTTDAGAAIPTVVLNKIIEKMETVGVILPLVTRTAYKGGLSIPKSTVKPTATWVSEGSGSDKQKKDTSGKVVFAYYKLRCAISVTIETDTMALSAFEANLINNIVEAMIKAIETSIVTGTGSGQPTGILAAATTVPTGQTIKVIKPAYADLIAAEAALPQAYENGAVWLMSKKTFMAYYGLTDDQGQPIGRINYGLAGKPERSLLGRPVICNDYVASYSDSLTTGTKFAAIFNLKDYVLNTNLDITIKKYEDDDTDDQVTKAITLADGKPVDVNSLVVLEKDEAEAEAGGGV